MAVCRLDKFLADAGIGTRSQVKELIKKKKIKVNDNYIMSPDLKIDTEKDLIFADNALVSQDTFRYYMFHKPSGCVTATTDSHDKTVMDFFSDINIKGLFPVGRLDKDTEGLLLITNDGELAHKLLSPRKHVDKTYFVITDCDISKEAAETLENGIDIGEKNKTLPAKVDFPTDNKKETLITISEGKFHQIKRMYQKAGANVIYLKRLSMGSLKLDENLEKGCYRPLTDKEIKELKHE